MQLRKMDFKDSIDLKVQDLPKRPFENLLR
jgi:hypothetical protein